MTGLSTLAIARKEAQQNFFSIKPSIDAQKI
jgi:hypothetical protein